MKRLFEILFAPGSILEVWFSLYTWLCCILLIASLFFVFKSIFATLNESQTKGLLYITVTMIVIGFVVSAHPLKVSSLGAAPLTCLVALYKAKGRVKKFYIVTTILALLCLFATTFIDYAEFRHPITR